MNYCMCLIYELEELAEFIEFCFYSKYFLFFVEKRMKKYLIGSFDLKKKFIDFFLIVSFYFVDRIFNKLFILIFIENRGNIN